jgi:hypothetical protein
MCMCVCRGTYVLLTVYRGDVCFVDGFLVTCIRSTNVCVYGLRMLFLRLGIQVCVHGY